MKEAVSFVVRDYPFLFDSEKLKEARHRIQNSSIFHNLLVIFSDPMDQKSFYKLFLNRNPSD